MGMRRRGAEALVLAAALVVASCDGGNGGGDGAAGRAAEEASCPIGRLDRVSAPVSIDVWHSMPAENKATLEQLTAAFNASQDKVKVNLAFQGTYQESLDKFLAAIRGGTAPALVQLEDKSMQLVIDSGSVLPAQACVDADDYDTSDHLERVIDYFTVQGKLWPVPFNLSTPILYYNKRAFERAGLDPNRPPATLDEVREYSRRVMISGASRHGLAFHLAPPSDFEQWFALAGQPYVNHGNGREERATRVLFDNDLGREIFTKLDEMVADGTAYSVGRDPTLSQGLQAIAAGDAAMTIQTSAALSSVFKVLSTGTLPNVSLGVGPMPRVRGGGGVAVGGGALWIVNRSSPEKQEAAWRFAKWLNEPQQQATWHVGTAYLPVRRSSLELPAVRDLWAQRPEWRVAYDQLLAGEQGVGSAGPVIGPYSQQRDAVSKGLERMLLEDMPPAEALRLAAEEANAALSDYNRRVGGG